MISTRTGAFLLSFAAACIALAPRTAHSQSETAPEILVTDEELSGGYESDKDASGFVQVIEADDAWRGYETVGRLLEKAAGIRIRRFGSREDFSTISVRGSTASQVRVLVDGVSYSRADDAVVNLSDLPVDSIERIEVFRGFTPVRFASSGASSVINIVTKSPERGRRAGSLTLGSFRTGKLTLDASEPTEAGAISATLTVRQTDGDFDFFDDNNTPQNPFDDGNSERLNNELQSWDFALRYRGEQDDGDLLNLAANTHYKDEGSPGFDLPQSTESAFRMWRTVASASFESRHGWRSGVDLTILDETVDDPTNITGGIDTSLGFPYESAETLTFASTITGGYSRPVGGAHLLDLSFEAAFETAEQTFRLTAADQSAVQERFRLAIAAGDEIYIESLKLSVMPQLRYESLWNRADLDDLAGPPIPEEDEPPSQQDALNPRIGLRWDATSELAFKANASSYFRPPGFGELYGDAGFSASNPALGPEEGEVFDAGFTFQTTRVPRPLRKRVRSFAFEYAWFRNEVDDLIVFVPSGGRVPRPQNIGRAVIEGHELRLTAAGKLPADTSWRIESSATLQDPENRTPGPETLGNQLPSLPEEEVVVEVSLARGRWSLAYDLDYRGTVFLDAANTPIRDFEVEPRTLHGLELAWTPVDADFRIALELDNLTDEQPRDVVGFPVPGRALYLTLSYAFFTDDEDR